MPNKTFIAREEKSVFCFKASKGGVTLSLEANADGEFKLKPVLIYSSENPKSS